MKFLIKITLFVCGFIIIISNKSNGQEDPRIIVDIPSNQKPWNNTSLNNSPTNFQFAIVTDRTGGHRPGVFMDAVNKINLLQPEFVMSVGDMIEGYTQDTARLNYEWKEFNGFIDNLSMPFFYVPGNHDITNEVMEDKWKELFGVTFYHFVYNDVLFLCLNSEDNLRGSGKGTIGDEQFEYIEKVLEENADVKWTLVFLHQPLWIQTNTIRWKEVENILASRSYNVFAGHYHRYFKSEKKNGKYIALGTTGGGSRLRGTAYGEFDHVVWVTMTDEGPILANLLLEGIWDENVVTQEIVEIVRGRPFPVKIEPVFLVNKKESGVTAVVKITNSLDMPMNVKIDGLVNPSVFYTLAETEISVAPNSVSTFNLDIPNEAGIDLTMVEAIKLSVEVTYLYDNGPDLVLQADLNFLPMYKRNIARAKKRVSLDGDFREWQAPWIELNPNNVIGSPFDHTGKSDCDIKFASTYDDDRIYLAFDITDDEIYTNENASTFEQDALVIALDARPQHLSAENMGAGRHKDWMLFARSFKEENPIFNEDMLPEGVESFVKRTASGMAIEISIPIEYLDNMQLKPWSSMRLGIGYYDFDQSGNQRTEVFWYPSWDANTTLPGSGMMFKEQNE